MQNTQGEISEHDEERRGQSHRWWSSSSLSIHPCSQFLSSSSCIDPCPKSYNIITLALVTLVTFTILCNIPLSSAATTIQHKSQSLKYLEQQQHPPILTSKNEGVFGHRIGGFLRQKQAPPFASPPSPSFQLIRRSQLINFEEDGRKEEKFRKQDKVSNVHFDENDVLTRNDCNDDDLDKTFVVNNTKQPKQQEDEHHHHKMASNLKQFNNVNEDLVFEDSVDLGPPPSNETDDENELHVSTVNIRRADIVSNDIADPLMASDQQFQMQISHRQLEPEVSVSNVVPSPAPKPINEFDIYQSRFPVRRRTANDLVKLRDKTETEELGKPISYNGEFNLSRRHQEIVRKNVFDDVNKEKFVTPMSRARGDHILRPYTHRKASHRIDNSWVPMVPVIDLQRIKESGTHRILPTTFHKRSPLLSGNNNEEGFILPQSGALSDVANNISRINRRDDDLEKSNNFHKRFGDSLAFEKNLRTLLEDINLNDLENLEEVPPPSLPNRPKIARLIKAHKAGGSKRQAKSQRFDNLPQAGTPQSPNNIPPPPTDPQMMPMFIDKFLSDFANQMNQQPPNGPAPEGFTLPPPPPQVNQPSFRPHDLLSLHHPNMPSLPINQIDNGPMPGEDPDVVDVHMKNNHHDRRQVKPLPPSPSTELFPNDILSNVSPPPSSDTSNEPNGDNLNNNSFDVWPKIFRFTDGRTNLHDFEREKKRSRIKFNQKKMNALYNIKRESFLILHGGTFSQ